MSYVPQMNCRSLREIFCLAKDIGDDNVLINDFELGAVLGSEDSPISSLTIKKERCGGWIDIPKTTGRNTVVLSRLSDALELRDRRFKVR